MEKDKFDNKLIEIESKSFEVNMLMSEFVLEILETSDNMKSEIYCELPYYDSDKGYRTLIADAVFLDMDTRQILVTEVMLNGAVMWDDLNIAAKEIIITELHLKYKSSGLYNSFNVKNTREEMH